MATTTRATSHDEAQESANHIMDYWARRGYVVHAWVKRITTSVPKQGEVVDDDSVIDLDHITGWGVRTNMVNGLPPELYEQKKRTALGSRR